MPLTTVRVDVVADGESLIERVEDGRFMQVTHGSQVVFHGQDVGVPQGRHCTLPILQYDPQLLEEDKNSSVNRAIEAERGFPSETEYRT